MLNIQVNKRLHQLLDDFNFWISLSLSDSFSPKLGLRPKLIRKLKWRFSFP